MGKLEGKVAIITGGGSGIGRASCLRFAAEGARVVVADVQSRAAEETAEEIRRAGHEALAVECDVTSAKSCADAVERTLERYGRIDLLFNNAGTPSPVPLADLTEEEWDRTFAVNTKSIFLMTKAVLPALRAAGGGAIVNTASDAGLVAVGPGQIAYCASKGAAVTLTKALALELAPDGIRVNCICPGWTWTPMMQQFYEGTFPDPAERERAIAEGQRAQMMGRFAQPDEMAAAAVFLCSDDASYVNGVALSVDGGLIAYR